MTEIKVEGLTRNLYPHQLSSVYHLERREQTKKIFTGAMEITSNIGLFSDIGGFGKTLSLIALIARNRLTWKLEEPYTHASFKYTDSLGGVLVKRFQSVSDEKCNTTLVVVHPNVIPQWAEELKGSCLSFTIVTTKQDILELNPDVLEVIVCSHLLYQPFVARFLRVWKRVIFDDPISLNTPKMHSLDAGFIWFVTDATGFADCFRRRRITTHHFIKTLFGQMPLDVFQSLVVKNNDSYVMRSWPLLPPLHIVYNCGENEEESSNKTIQTIERMGGVIKKDGEQLLEKDTCPICLEEHGSEVIDVQCCGKKFGADCLVRWFKEEEKASETCPHCRRSLTGKDLVYYSGFPRHRTRNRTVVNIINSYPKGQFILFSTLRDNFRAIQVLSSEFEIPYANLHGGISNEKTISQFREGAIKVLFLSAKQPGTGLNLEFVTDLILYHEVSPSIETVLVSRVHRIGRRLDDPLRIHHLKLV